jgi:hypothetical protein
MINSIKQRIGYAKVLLLEAASRIGSAVTIPEIPDRFKMLKIIGRGATSIVLEKDPETVIVLTRDDMKTDWMNRSSTANFIGNFDGLNSKGANFAFRELPIKAYSMPKLYPLDGPNKKRVRQIIKEFQIIDRKYQLNNTEKANELRELADEFELKFNKRHELAEFADFIVNYDESQYNFDFKQNQFMQDKAGNIVVNDPIVSREIMDIFRMRQRKTPVSRLSYDRGLV